MIDPEFWSDEEIGQWSHSARLFYIGLWNFADDKGRFKAADALLKAQIFPYDNKIDINKLKKELNHKIQWYEAENLQYGFIRNFNKHQRIDKPTESKLPEPPLFVDNSPNTPRTLPPNISKEKLIEDNINISAQADSLLKQFSNVLQEKIKVYIERVKLRNKSKVITVGREITLLTELWNSKERCADDNLFGYALDMSIQYGAENIGYINAIIKNKKAGK